MNVGLPREIFINNKPFTRAAKGVKDEIFLYLCKHGHLPFDQKFQNVFENLGIPHEVVFFYGIYAIPNFYSDKLVLLAAITVSWTSHVRMTRIR